MIEVHAPHESVHTWRDFFIHIATICVGLLIAIGLEQAVEAIHRSHERAELRESLQRESEQVVRDAVRLEEIMTADVKWQLQVGELLAASGRTHQPLGVIPPFPSLNFDVPSNPIYAAAKASNKLQLLTQQEVQAYGELDNVLVTLKAADDRRLVAFTAVLEAQLRLYFSEPALSGTPLRAQSPLTPLSGLTLSIDDLREINKVNVQLGIASGSFRFWSRQAHGATLALSQGERDLRKIQAAERQFDNLP